MAETESPDEPMFHTKRKPNINSEDSQEHPNKAQKLETLTPLDEAKECQSSLKSNNGFEVPNSNCSSFTEDKIEKVESDLVAEEGRAEDGQNDDEFVDGVEDDDGDEDDDEDGEESNGKAEVDRKGKGIVKADKGKGKLIEEDDGDDDDSGDDDDCSDDGVVSDGDSDLSDDPLAEVDLNNILPSRTRRRTIHPGEYIANDLGNDDEDDDSDDSDV